MTRKEILAMKPGEELDVLVAEKVMGTPVHWERAVVIGNHLKWVRCEPYRIGEIRRTEDDKPVPPYSTDIAAAWDVATSAGGLVVRHLDPIDRWTARFGSSVVMAEAVPEAICKARLLATLETLEEQPMG